MFLADAFGALLKLARVALASLLLVGVPLADAATCAGEEFVTHASVVVDMADADLSPEGGTQHDDQRSGDAQHCVHGHCHHAGTFRATDTLLTSALVTSISVSWPGEQPRLGRVPGGLERPPKV